MSFFLFLYHVSDVRSAAQGLPAGIVQSWPPVQSSSVSWIRGLWITLLLLCGMTTLSPTSQLKSTQKISDI